MVIIFVFPVFMPTTPASNPAITCLVPTVKIRGVCSVFWSKIVPSENVAVYVIETISHVFTLFLFVHHASTKRESDTIDKRLMIFFIFV